MPRQIFGINASRLRQIFCFFILYSCPYISAGAGFGPTPLSLKGLSPPEVPGLFDGSAPIVINKEKALVLGKALFWDSSVGSDGMACASCHFHAGADSRTKNQLAPSGKINQEIITGALGFDQAPDGSSFGPSHTLRKHDFPFVQVSDPVNPNAIITYESDDVVSSSGTFGGEFRSVYWYGPQQDNCSYESGSVFHAGASNYAVRKVSDRNAPTVINAVFNFRNFWDGRANNIFNGSSAWGNRDPDAGVWQVNESGEIEKVRLELKNSSLASQAVSPPQSSIEMACQNRRLADLGRKLMWRRPLENQAVHWDDSVLGEYANSQPGQLSNGLNTFYRLLVKQAFDPRFWSYATRTESFGQPPTIPPWRPLPYEQYEANFGMFFAIALQIYQSTLISDDSPFDRSAVNEEGIPVDLSEAGQRGFTAFRDGHCALCHIGPHFTSAAVASNAELFKTKPHAFGNAQFKISVSNSVVTRFPAMGGIGLMDVGFTNTGVSAHGADIGLGATDPFGNPLSFSEQFLQLLSGNPSAQVDPYVNEVRVCDFDSPLALDSTRAHPLMFTHDDGALLVQQKDSEGCFRPNATLIPSPEVAAAELTNDDNKKMRSATSGAYKVPNLRNVELTGPYMHNGGMASLEQVVDFYVRGGNYDPPGKQFGFVFPQAFLRSDAELKVDLITFMQALTDERVRYERAPFDHPAIRIPHGHNVGIESSMGTGLAEDQWLLVPAVGAEGRDEPLKTFQNILE